MPKKAIIETFVEETRRYDTWEWITKYKDELAHELTLLFDILGCAGYIELMVDKLENATQFALNNLEIKLIESKKNKTLEKLKNYTNKIIYRKINDLKVGIVFIEYEYRNDLAEHLRKEKIDADFVMLIALDAGSISYRPIKEGVNVRTIAESFGGKGHDTAASSPITEAQKEQFLNIILKIN